MFLSEVIDEESLFFTVFPVLLVCCCFCVVVFFVSVGALQLLVYGKQKNKTKKQKIQVTVLFSKARQRRTQKCLTRDSRNALNVHDFRRQCSMSRYVAVAAGRAHRHAEVGQGFAMHVHRCFWSRCAACSCRLAWPLPPGIPRIPGTAGTQRPTAGPGSHATQNLSQSSARPG